MLNPVHLQTLQEVIRLRSFAGAANRLGYTPSAVSQQMAALERATGAVLFERTARSVRPTTAAMDLERRARPILAELAALETDLTEGGPSGAARLALGVFPSAALYVLPSVLTSKPWRELDIELSVQVAECADIIGQLTADVVNLAIVYRFEHSSVNWPDSVQAVTIWRDRMVAIVPEAWAADLPEYPALADLESLPWISHFPGTSGAMSVDWAWAAQDLSPRTIVRCDDYAATREMVAAELAAAIVPQMATWEMNPGIRVISPTDLDSRRDVVALTRAGRDDVAAQAVVSLFGEAFHVMSQTASLTMP